jgi:hypothetical protein
MNPIREEYKSGQERKEDLQRRIFKTYKEIEKAIQEVEREKKVDRCERTKRADKRL